MPSLFATTKGDEDPMVRLHHSIWDAVVLWWLVIIAITPACVLLKLMGGL